MGAYYIKQNSVSPHRIVIFFFHYIPVTLPGYSVKHSNIPNAKPYKKQSQVWVLPVAWDSPCKHFWMLCGRINTKRKGKEESWLRELCATYTAGEACVMYNSFHRDMIEAKAFLDALHEVLSSFLFSTHSDFTSSSHWCSWVRKSCPKGDWSRKQIWKVFIQTTGREYITQTQLIGKWHMKPKSLASIFPLISCLDIQAHWTAHKYPALPFLCCQVIGDFFSSSCFAFSISGSPELHAQVLQRPVGHMPPGITSIPAGEREKMQAKRNGQAVGREELRGAGKEWAVENIQMNTGRSWRTVLQGRERGSSHTLYYIK